MDKTKFQKYSISFLNALVIWLSQTFVVFAAPVIIENPLGQSSTISSVILNITNGIFNLATAIAAIVIGIGAFQYLFSFGSDEKIKQAKNTLWYAVIGIIITLVGKSIVLLIQSIIR